MDKFEETKIGVNMSIEFLKKNNRLSDFWYSPSSIDIVNYANKIWDEQQK